MCVYVFFLVSHGFYPARTHAVYSRLYCHILFLHIYINSWNMISVVFYDGPALFAEVADVGMLFFFWPLGPLCVSLFLQQTTR